MITNLFPNDLLLSKKINMRTFSQIITKTELIIDIHTLLSVKVFYHQRPGETYTLEELTTFFKVSFWKKKYRTAL